VGLQAPANPHTPSVQWSEQHCEAFPQSMPSLVQLEAAAHWPATQLPEQQAAPPAHAPPLGVQLPAPQTPSVHICTQHCDAEVQASPVTVHGPPALLADTLLVNAVLVVDAVLVDAFLAPVPKLVVVEPPTEG
jgi:hypothetical protein